MDYQEAIKEAEIQIDMYEGMILYNKDFEPKNNNSNYERKMDFLKTTISAMQDLQQYEKIGTLEEVREAVEKQRKVKPEDGEYCPICHTFLKDEDDVPGFYCMNCGQAIDWSGEYEIN